VDEDVRAAVEIEQLGAERHEADQVDPLCDTEVGSRSRIAWISRMAGMEWVLYIILAGYGD